MEISRLREARRILTEARGTARQSGNAELGQGVDAADESVAALLARAEKVGGLLLFDGLGSCGAVSRAEAGLYHQHMAVTLGSFTWGRK